MKLTLNPEQTGLDNYGSCTNCPIASALKNRGYFGVAVTPGTWTAVKFVWWPPFIWPCRGRIPAKIDSLALRQWSKRKQEKPIIFEL